MIELMDDDSGDGEDRIYKFIVPIMIKDGNDNTYELKRMQSQTRAQILAQKADAEEKLKLIGD